MLRFKTEKEFLEEFGEDWILEVKWNNMHAMDYLFGLPCDPEWVGNRQDIHSDKAGYHSEWYVTQDMVTDKPLPIELTNEEYALKLMEWLDRQRAEFACNSVTAGFDLLSHKEALDKFKNDTGL